MEFETAQDSSRISTVTGVLIVVTFFCLCVAQWYETSHVGYLISGVGFLVIAPVWYQAPLTMSILKAPVGSTLKKPRMLSKTNQVLSLVGYSIILIGFCYVLFF